MTELTTAQLVLDANTITSIINNINSLYSTAIGQLTTYTFGVIGVVGVLIPIIVTIVQTRSAKADKENLQAHITSEISKARIEIREEMANELTALIKVAESKLNVRMEEKFSEYDDKFQTLEANTFHLQANQTLKSKGDLANCAQDYCHASSLYFNGGDEANGQRTLKLLTEKCLPHVTKSQYEEFDLESFIQNLIDKLKELNITGKYSDQISSLIKANKEAKNRVPEPNVQKA